MVVQRPKPELRVTLGINCHKCQKFCDKEVYQLTLDAYIVNIPTQQEIDATDYGGTFPKPTLNGPSLLKSMYLCADCARNMFGNILE